MALISLTQTNRLDFDQTPNGVSCLRGGVPLQDERNFPTNIPSTRQVIAWHKKLWDIKGIKGVGVAVVVRPSALCLSCPACPSFQTEHKRNRRQRGKLANENTDSTDERRSEDTVPGLGHGHGRTVTGVSKWD